MRRIISTIATSLLSVVLLASYASVPVAADDFDLTPEQTSQIKENCVSIKSSLSQLHASDALLRVNRGQVYESMATKLMNNFNSRLSNNKLDNKAMVTVTQNYRTSLDKFRNDYIAYEQKLSQTIKVDCTQQPTEFHAGVLEARKLRAVVHEDVVKLHRIVDDYRTSVGDFLLNFDSES